MANLDNVSDKLENNSDEIKNELDQCEGSVVDAVKNMDAGKVASALEKNYKGKTRDQIEKNHGRAMLVQAGLSHIGYADKVWDIDGYYGPKTKNAVSEYQKERGLKGDWRAGPQTINLLIEELHIHDAANGTKQSTDIAKPLPENALEASKMQDRLWKHTMWPGVVDMHIQDNMLSISSNQNVNGDVNKSDFFQNMLYYISTDGKQIMNDMGDGTLEPAYNLEVTTDDVVQVKEEYRPLESTTV